jgi:choice-of-anchor A domain-containing protein/uncharacterized repeat protein (TIGR01451 family)
LLWLLPLLLLTSLLAPLAVSPAVNAAPAAVVETCSDQVGYVPLWMGQYGVIAYGNLSTSSDIEGRIFAGNLTGSSSATLAKNESSLPAGAVSVELSGTISSGSPVNIQYGSLRVKTGTAISGGPVGWTVAGRTFNLNAGNSGATAAVSSTLTTKGNTIRANLAAASTQLATATATGSNTVTVPSSPGALIFNVNFKDASGLAIFNVSDSSIFENANVSQIQINNNVGATTILINVSGTTVNWSNGNMVGTWLNDASSTGGRARTLWNFYQATTLNFNSRNFMGAVLAPKASLTTSGNIDGVVAVTNLTTTAEVHLPKFMGTVNTCNSFDLALNKVEKNHTTYEPGDSAYFEIYLYNQGTVAATNIVVKDYLPAGTTFTGFWDPGTTGNGNPVDVNFNTATGVFTISQLLPGDSVLFEPIVLLPAGYVQTSVTNCVEIAGATGGLDVDSIYDTTNGNTAGETTNYVNDQTDGNGLAGGDEDDQDCHTDTVSVPRFSLGNQVFYDTNNNGLRGTDAGIDGVTVRLLDSSNNVLSTTTTAGGGFYRFDGLVSGDYKVEVVTPGGYQSSTDISSSANPNNNTDNDDNGVTLVGNAVRSNVITLGPTANEPTGESPTSASGQGAADNQANMTLDFGFYSLELGNQVWDDTTYNGVKDPGEPGIDGVSVALVNPATGAVVSTTVTANGGYYTFTGFVSGTYVVSVTAPLNHVSTLPDAGDPDTDIDDNDDNGPGNGSGQIVALPVTMTPGSSTNGSTVNPANGLTSNPRVDFGAQAAAVGDRVWQDLDMSADPSSQGSGDGLQNSTVEQGVDGIIVQLYRARDNQLISTTLTSNGGLYRFDGLIPDDYYLVFINPFDSGIWTAVNVDANATDGGDSDADGDLALPPGLPPGEAARTEVFNLAPGEYDPNWDAGLIDISTFGSSSIGDFFWHDLNKDGLQDVGEPGVPGIVVTLYRSASGSVGQPGSGTNGTVIMTTTTNELGRYLFTGLDAGYYYVKFNLPDKWLVSPRNAGTDNAFDSDVDLTTGGRTSVFYLPINTDDLTWDAGIYDDEREDPTGLEQTEEEAIIGGLRIYLPVVHN